MGKDKLKRFALFLSYSNCFTFPYHMKGKWKTDYFKNNNPIVLELGCGKGEYTINLALNDSSKNYIGVDLKSNRMWRGAKTALDKNIHHVAFIRTTIEKINQLFEPNEADEIWITFPDPYPKDRHAKHRLTHARFLLLYADILKPDGMIHFKTDDDDLFAFTKDVLKQLKIEPKAIFEDVHQNPEAFDILKNIQTYYERLFMQKGRTIKYLCFTLPPKQIISDYLEQLKLTKSSATLVQNAE